MELVDRYLQAVGLWLLFRQKKDIIRELSEDIHSQIEERESQMGRPLNEFEIAGILKERGNPMLVASRFLPQEQFIGPLLFPIYKLALKVVAVFYLVPWALVWTGMMIFNAGYRSERLHSLQLLKDWISFWQLGLFLFAVVTILFAVLDRAQAKSHWLDKWNPMDLPAKVKHYKPSVRAQALAELICTLVFIVAWLSLSGLAQQVLAPVKNVFQFSPEWQRYYWPIFGTSLLALGQQITTLARPQWTWLRPAVQVVVNIIGLAIMWLMLKSGAGLVLLNPEANQARYGAAFEIVNRVIYWSLLGLAVAFGIAATVYAVQCVKRLRNSQATPQSPLPCAIL